MPLAASGLPFLPKAAGALTWMHAHAWVKPLFMRIPPKLLLRGARRTGVLVLSPDGRRPLYAAMYEGPLLTSIPSAVATPKGRVPRQPGSRRPRCQQTGVVRLDWPSSLR